MADLKDSLRFWDMETDVFYSGDSVMINVSDNYGQTGEVVRWVHDNWYVVKCDNAELMLDASRGEIGKGKP